MALRRRQLGRDISAMHFERKKPGLPLLVSLVPNLRGGRGHVFWYHRALGEAAELLGWNHRVLVTPDEHIRTLPAGWSTCLDRGNTDRDIPVLRKLDGARRWCVSVARALRSLSSLSDRTVVFFEGFGTLQLAGLLLALLWVPRDTLHVWILYYVNVRAGRLLTVYRLLNGALGRLLPVNHFRMLTDSELLARSLTDSFGVPVRLMPMLGEAPPPLEGFPREPDELVCWWPGEPRWEKGLAVVRHLVAMPGAHLRLVCARDAGLPSVSGGPRLHCVSTHLPRDEYLRWLATADLILLPYDPSVYGERTSGIFLECVLAGRLPVVSRGTWMAWQLERFELGELAIDWYRPDLPAHLAALARDSSLRARLDRMRAAFLDTHNVRRFAEALDALYEADDQ